MAQCGTGGFVSQVWLRWLGNGGPCGWPISGVLTAAGSEGIWDFGEDSGQQSRILFLFFKSGSLNSCDRGEEAPIRKKFSRGRAAET